VAVEAEVEIEAAVAEVAVPQIPLLELEHLVEACQGPDLSPTLGVKKALVAARLRVVRIPAYSAARTLNQAAVVPADRVCAKMPSQQRQCGQGRGFSQDQRRGSH
jgi:hypothetical protein